MDVTNRHRSPTHRICAGLFALLPWFGHDEAAGRIVETGNRLYQQGEYAAALEKYQEAERLVPEAAELAFNKATILVRQGQVDEAVEGYMTALKSDDLILKGRAKYNMGIIKLQQAQESERSVGDASWLASAAVRLFRESLTLEPGNADARYNLELAVGLRQQLEARLIEQQRAGPREADSTSLRRGAALQDLVRNEGSGQQRTDADKFQRTQEQQTDQQPDTFSASDRPSGPSDTSLPVAMGPDAAAALMERLLEKIDQSEAWLREQRRAQLQASREYEPW
jgi:tetratricopeptide (TPR) repeat protein